MSLFAALTFSGRGWFPLVIGVLAVTLISLVWGYRNAPAGPIRWICWFLKFLGIAALAFCLLDPHWTGQRVKPGANTFALLADNSQGMQIHDPGSSHTRGEQMREMLDPSRASWPATLSDDFEVRRYLFDRRLQPTRDFSELNFEGPASALGSSLQALAQRFQGQPLAGIFLFTDGNATDLPSGIPDTKGLPPVYPVVIGGLQPPRDISLQEIHASQTAFEDAPVTVEGAVASSGYQGESITAKISDRSGKLIAEQTQRARDREATAFHFNLRAEKSGLSFYQMTVAPAGAPVSTTNSTAGEATLANNHRVVVVDRGQGPYRVLYVAGRPNWEYKFLNRAIQEDDQVQLVGLIRVAKREPKFDFRGRAGETSNPLFRGFGNQAHEEVERYDQPVLVRLNTRDELELRSGFPRVPEDLYGYHAIIVDDLESEFFQPDQALLLQKFVSERGGGFLMLGGADSFRSGKYQRTPIGDMLPVYLDRDGESEPPAPMRLQLAREGWLQPWARVRDNEMDEKTRWDAMPMFEVFNRMRDVKPGASVIATAKSQAGKEYPAIIVQRFGRGRSAAITIGDFWRWGMRDADTRKDQDKAWRQIVRWLVADVPNRVELTADPIPGDPNSAMRLQVRVRDPKFQPLDNAAVAIEVDPVNFDGAATSSSTNKLRILAEPTLSEAGLYQATYVPRASGGFHAIASVTNNVGAEVGRAEAGWSTDLAAEEFRSLVPNVALLEDLARRTGGEVVAAGKLDHFVRSLQSRKAPVMEAWSYPVWHTPWVFMFALGCLAGEWGLRRWKGMP